MRIAIVTLCMSLAVVGNTAAQTVEVGASIASACVGSDGSICDDFEGRHLLAAAHASWWTGNRIELGARVARMGLRSQRLRTFQTPDVQWVVTDRSREFVSLLFTYHFLREHRVRPMLALGSGWYAAADRVTCETPGCEMLLPRYVTIGEHRRWLVDAIFVVGLSGVVRERWVWRGGWQTHRFANDENSTYEFFLGAGYRFRPAPRRRSTRE